MNSIKMENTYFSIIIPTFNSEKHLTNCLRSIIDQDFKDYEIIIIDGKSSDNTCSIILEYAAIFKDFKWVSEKDNGIYDAMNKGLGLAAGEWIYFLGSDDKIHSNKVLSIINQIDKNDCDIIYGNVMIIGDTSWAKNGEFYDWQFDLSKLLSKNICHQAIFYNKSCFIKNKKPFNISYKLCADYDFNLYCWSKFNFHFTETVIADFYGGGESTKFNRDLAFEKDLKRNLNKYFGKNKSEIINHFKHPSELSLIERVRSKLKKLSN